MNCLNAAAKSTALSARTEPDIVNELSAATDSIDPKVAKRLMINAPSMPVNCSILCYGVVACEG